MKKRTNRREILLCIYMLIAAMSTYGQTNTIYIDPQYVGTKNGTITQPYSTWADLTWKSGYTYLFKCGTTYTTSTSLRATANNIKIGSYGTGNRPIISSSVNGGKIFDFGSLSNIVVSDLEVVSINNAQSCFHFITGGRAALINCKIHGSEWGVRNISSSGLFRITNCEIYMTGDDGSYNEKLDSIEVSGTYIHDVNQKWFVNQSETYSGGDVLQCHDVKYFNIHDNILDHSNTGNKFCFISENSGDGIISTGSIINNTLKRSNEGNCIFLYSDQNNVLIKGNKFMNAGLGIYNHSVNLHVYYNEFINISDRVFEGLGPSTSNTKIINNTFYNVNKLIAECYNENLTFQNNIVYNCYGRAFEGHANIMPDYNCYYEMPVPGTTVLGANSINADPLCNAPASQDFKLKSSSPCIDKGSNILGSCTDLIGCKVPFGTSAEIGALEYSSTVPPANKPPVVSLTSPTNNSTFTAPATVTLNASANDSDGTISKVEFYNGTSKLGESATSPYSYTWNNIAASSYTLTAVATDNSGAKTTSSVVSIVVKPAANKMPVVSITAPVNNSIYIAPASVAINASSSDPDGTISKVEFYNGTTKLGESATPPYTYTWNNIAPATLSLTAVATDNSGATTTSSTVSVVVNPAPNKIPAVSITAPTNNSILTAPATVTINVNATDSDGTINKVEFYDGTTKLGESATFPYTYTLNNMSVSNYSLTAVASDNSGARNTSSAISIIVNPAPNKAPSVSITAPVNNSVFIAPASLTITASASDSDGSISKVEFYSGSTKLGESLTVPYSYTWNNVAMGTYSLTAVATDNLNSKTSSAAITAVVNNKVVPVGAIFYWNSDYSGQSVTLAPGNYTVAQLTALGMIDNTISSIVTNGYQVVAYKDDNFLGTPLTLTANQPNLAVVGWNDQISSIKVIVVNSPSNIPPVVSLTSPTNGQNYSVSTVGISASANDADGTISKVEFYNGSTKIGESSKSPYAMTWTNVPYGSYKLTAVATDNLGAKTTSTAKTIYVNTSKAAENPDSLNAIETATAVVSFKVYPNPNNGIFNISSSNLPLNNGVQVRITDITGKTLYSAENFRLDGIQEFDITNYRPGIYFVTLTYEHNKTLNQKIIKK